MKLYAIVGAGGFGREVMPLAAAMLQSRSTNNDYQLVFVDQYSKVAILNGYPVMSMDEFIQASDDEKYFNIAIANHEIRKTIADTLISKSCQPFGIRAMNMIDLGHNQIGDGAIFCPFTTVTANAKIGNYFHCNIYSYIAHDCIIGDYVTFAPNVHCNGNVIIEEGAYLGTGAMIKQGTPDKPIIIGKGAVIGMGAVVTKSVAAYQTVIGNPARQLVRAQTDVN